LGAAGADQRHLSLGLALNQRLEEATIELLASPDYLPMQIDLPRKRVLFFEMSRDDYRRSVFLDNRAIRSRSGLYAADLDALTTGLQGFSPSHPVHYILHGAFCASTLLARYLEVLPGFFVLKEPGLLTQLAVMKDDLSGDFGGSRDAIAARWDSWLDMSTVLLARAYQDDHVVIIKASDLCNWIGHLLLAQSRRTKILFLSSPLKPFLLSVLKSEDRRTWVRHRLRNSAERLARIPFLAEALQQATGDGECGAVMWLLNGFLCASLATGPQSERVLVLDSESIVHCPNETVHAVVRFFVPAIDPSGMPALARFAPLTRHAKDLDLPYDAASRTRDLQDADARYGAEAEAAVAWAAEKAGAWVAECPFALR
jgi:hypothetical protein